MLKKIVHSFCFLFSLLSICWILLGSTIEFHQRYVYHNHIDLVQSQIVKLKEKDSKKYFRFLDKNQGFQKGPDFMNNLGHNTSEIAILNRCEKSIFSRYLFDLLTPEYIYDNSLRGPPVA